LEAHQTWLRAAQEYPVVYYGHVEYGLPRIAAILDGALANRVGEALLLLTNTDLCLTLDAYIAIEEQLQHFDCTWANRIDVPEFRWMTRAELCQHSTYVGVDLFAMHVHWWIKNRERWPDLLLGREGWDWVLRTLMQESGAVAITPTICWHVAHEANWTKDLHNEPGQRHNRNLARQWALKYGYAHHIHPGPYLFK
jgi:hypothetical protein